MNRSKIHQLAAAALASVLAAGTVAVAGGGIQTATATATASDGRIVTVEASPADGWRNRVATASVSGERVVRVERAAAPVIESFAEQRSTPAVPTVEVPSSVKVSNEVDDREAVVVEARPGLDVNVAEIGEISVDQGVVNPTIDVVIEEVVADEPIVVFVDLGDTVELPSPPAVEEVSSLLEGDAAAEVITDVRQERQDATWEIAQERDEVRASLDELDVTVTVTGVEDEVDAAQTVVPKTVQQLPTLAVPSVGVPSVEVPSLEVPSVQDPMATSDVAIAVSAELAPVAQINASVEVAPLG